MPRTRAVHSAAGKWNPRQQASDRCGANQVSARMVGESAISARHASRPPAFEERPERQRAEARKQKCGWLGNELEGEIVHHKLRGRRSAESRLTARIAEVKSINVQIIEGE